MEITANFFGIPTNKQKNEREKMGNRSNIVIRETETQSDNFLILYSHWGGDDNIRAVENVLRRTDRIGDSAYLSAQIFYEFTKLGNYDGGLGYGLWVGGWESVDQTDNPAVIVDADTGTITHTAQQSYTVHA
jgi:hypothetical protein